MDCATPVPANRHNETHNKFHIKKTLFQLKRPSSFHDFAHGVALQKISLLKNTLYATQLFVPRRPSIYIMFDVMNSVKRYVTIPNNTH